MYRIMQLNDVASDIQYVPVSLSRSEIYSKTQIIFLFYNISFE